MTTERRRLLRTVALIGIAFGSAGPAFGHTVGLSRGDYRIAGRNVTVTLTLARPELAASVPGLDADMDSALSESEIAASGPAIERIFVRGLELGTPSGACAGALQNVAGAEEDGVSIRALYTCPAVPNSVLFAWQFLAVLSHGHRHLADFADGAATGHFMAYAGKSQFEFTPQRSGGVSPGGWTATVWPLFVLGIEHILTGYDHLVFLLGLILVGGRMRSMLAVISAFTVAHSITLGLAAFEILTPSTRFVEPAIALSIAYVGIENWRIRDVSQRWMITFPFGLIHGFGFAGALRQIALPHAQIPAALLSFNLGVEAGQLAIVSVMLPVILGLRRHAWFADKGVKALSGAVALAGICWFVIRVGF